MTSELKPKLALKTVEPVVFPEYASLEQAASAPYSLFVYGDPQLAARVSNHLLATGGCEFAAPYGRFAEDATGSIIAMAAWLRGDELAKCRFRAAMALGKLNEVVNDPAIGQRIRLAAPCMLQPGKDELYLSRLAVAEHARGQGVGDGLLKACAADARALQVKCIVLEVAPQSEAAIRLYERHGFKETARHTTADAGTGSSLTYIHMMLQLQDA